MKILNLDKKRVCDISPDGKVAMIRKSDCVTLIYADREQRLHVRHTKEK